MENNEKDLAEINEYYLDELGKVRDICPNIPPLTKKEGKKLHKFMISLYFSDLINWREYKKTENMIEKNEIKKSRNDYIQEEKEANPGIFNKMLDIFKRKSGKDVEIQSPDDHPRLEQGTVKEEVIESENDQPEPPDESGTGEDSTLVF